MAVSWFENILSKSTPIVAEKHEQELAEALIYSAIRENRKTGIPLGTLLSASFDLYVSAGYYRNITHTGWLYCPESDPWIMCVYTNACGRCLLKGEFHFHPSKKPTSGIIGQATSRMLCVFFKSTSNR
jgi:hypothetical protein